MFCLLVPYYNVFVFTRGNGERVQKTIQHGLIHLIAYAVCMSFTRFFINGTFLLFENDVFICRHLFKNYLPGVDYNSAVAPFIIRPGFDAQNLIFSLLVSVKHIFWIKRNTKFIWRLLKNDIFIPICFNNFFYLSLQAVQNSHIFDFPA